MKFPAVNLPQLIGALLSALGLLIVLRWIFAIQWIATLLPGTFEMGINTPTMFVATGLCCIELAGLKTPSKVMGPVTATFNWLLIVLPSLVLIEHILGLQLGVDFVRDGVVPTPGTPFPGRVPPNTCVAFLAAGLSFLWMRRNKQPPTTWPLTVSVSVLTTVALAGLLGHLLRVESLYRVASFNRMLLPTSVGLTLLSVGLWLLKDQLGGDDARSMERHESLITRRSLSVLTVVAVSAGVSGFVVLRDTFEKSVADGVLLTATTNATSLTNTLDVSLWFPRTVATRPSVWESLEKLERSPRDEKTREFLQKVANSFLTAGLTGVELFNAEGKLLVSAGKLVGNSVTSINKLQAEGQVAQLRWQGGYLLYTENQVLLNGRVIGSVRTEQRMPIFDKLLSTIRQSSDTADALLCSRSGDQIDCAQSRIYREPFHMAMFKPNGQLNYPISHALAGETGVIVTDDLRGVEVVAAHVPLQPYGLGLVVKTDVSTLYAPLRERIQVLVLLLIGLVIIGTAALRMRVRPLLGQILKEQRRTQVILDNSNDAFVAIDHNGNITDWNLQAEQTFGWPASAAIGHNMADLIIPEEQREAHRKGFKAFLETGQGPVVNRRIEVTALHRLGHDIPIELAVAALRDGTGYLANAFARDITERKANEQKLAASEHRLRDITDNLPALIAYFDQNQHYQFANAAYQQWYGTDPKAMIGRSLADVVGPEAFSQISPYFQRALRGERVHFERHAFERPGEVHYLVDFIPDFGPSGEVLGCYAMVLDISARHIAELERAASERRLLAITDNVPALISQFDRDEKIVFSNPYCATVYGSTPVKLRGQTVRDVRGEEGYVQLQPHIVRALAGESVNFESSTTIEGEKRYFQQAYVPDVAGDGTVGGFYSVSFEITDRKRDEQRIAASERRLRAITDNLPVLISYIDSQERLTFLNATFSEWMGIEPKAVLGRPLREAIGQSLYDQRKAHLTQALNGERVRFDLESAQLGVLRHLQTEYIPDLTDDGQVAGIYTLTTDVTILKLAEVRLSELAHFDTLTGLPNRHQYNDKLQGALARAARSRDALALMFLDIDHFKAINDTLGHGMGDAVLKEFAARLQQSVRQTDTVARLAGDEFVIILESLINVDQPQMVAQKIIEQVRRLFVVDGREISVTTSIGIAFHESGTITPAELLESADKGLYAAKAAGRNTYQVYRA